VLLEQQPDVPAMDLQSKSVDMLTWLPRGRGTEQEKVCFGLGLSGAQLLIGRSDQFEGFRLLLRRVLTHQVEISPFYFAERGAMWQSQHRVRIAAGQVRLTLWIWFMSCVRNVHIFARSYQSYTDFSPPTRRTQSFGIIT
jgi:hypothetical protein